MIQKKVIVNCESPEMLVLYFYDDNKSIFIETLENSKIKSAVLISKKDLFKAIEELKTLDK